MLSYGMDIVSERRNIHLPLTVLCSSKKIEKAILAENVKVHRLGIGLEVSAFKNLHLKRKNYLAIMYHDMDSKKYLTAVKVANTLFESQVIDGVISFGRIEGYEKNPKPKGLIRHYGNATAEQVNEVFNQCKCFLMPSVTEGINLTPMESALCGCPAVLCDGAIDEVFYDKSNCLIARKENMQDMITMTTQIINNFVDYSDSFEKHMRETIKDMTWDKVVQNLKDILYANND
jgi:glycosyltransferase involved in cell wall biosynthesis